MISSKRSIVLGKSKKKKHNIAQYLFFLFLCIVCMLYSSSVGAHPPSEVTLSYDETEKTLTVTITHTTKDPAGHYVKSVEIKKNGKSLGVHSYQSQLDTSTFSYTYKVSASRGDLLEVIAVCNKFGSKTGTLRVGKLPT